MATTPDKSLTFGQKIIIGLVAGALVGALGVLVQHYASEHFVKRNGQKAIQ